MDKQNRVEALKALYNIELLDDGIDHSLSSLSKDRIDCVKAYLGRDSEDLEGDIEDYLRNLGGNEGLRKLQDDLIRELDSEEVNELAHYILEIFSEYQSDVEDWRYAIFLSQLFSLHPETFPPIQKEISELGISYPFSFPIFSKSNHETSLAIQAKLNTEQTEEDYSLVSLFAWGKDSLVEAQFQAWDAQPPNWWKPNHWKPDRKLKDRTLEAGWELTPEGKRRYLYHETCYPLIQATGEAKTAESMLREDNCQWCNQKLQNFLDLDLTDSRLSFLGLNGSRLVIAFCTWCQGFQDQYFEIDFDGNAKWSHYNSPEPPSRIEYDDLEPNTLVLAEKPRGTFEGLALTLDEYGQSQIGGFPVWVNREMFPTCPSCKKYMQFIGQVRWWDIIFDHLEGISYAYLCPDCKLSLVNYDQT